jgi:hypothetical protein
MPALHIYFTLNSDTPILQSFLKFGVMVTWGNPPSPAIDVRLIKLLLHESRATGGVFNRGAGPGVVGY